MKFKTSSIVALFIILAILPSAYARLHAQSFRSTEEKKYSKVHRPKAHKSLKTIESLEIKKTQRIARSKKGHKIDNVTTNPNSPPPKSVTMSPSFNEPSSTPSTKLFLPPDISCSSSALDYTLPVQGAFSSIPTPPGPHLGGLIAGLQAWVTGLIHYETPYSIRLEHMVDIIDWNCVAVYSSRYNDALTKTEPLIRAPSSIIVDDGTSVDLHTSDVRLMCIASAFTTVVEDWVPEAAPAMKNTLKAFEYPDIKYGYDNNVKACFANDNDLFYDGSSSNPDVNCLEDIALNACYKPSIVGKIVAQQVAEYGKYDGWNMYGEINADGSRNVFNSRRYRDTTGYYPVYNPYDNKLKKRWGPLLEDNGSGYFTRQEFVAPHIGTMGKPRLLSRDEVNLRVLSAPKYNYDKEARLLTSRLADLTDEKKMMIEFFDNKISVAFALVDNIAARGASFEQILNYIVGFTAGSYDTTLLAWKEKISHDLVRPTTWIQDQMPDHKFHTWVKDKGTQIVKGKEFEAFIRVMPHAEYPSGSSCIFQHVYEYTDDWIEENLGISGSMPLTLGVFTKGSSKSEPGITPAETITLSVSSLLELRDLGGQSRLDGGMHFTASIEASHKLCKGVGHAAAEFSLQLW